MSVYVDDMRRPAQLTGRPAKWSHLMADTPEELAGFAAQLGLNPAWIQHAGTHREHFDVTETVRVRALQLGAQPISYPRETGQVLAAKRAASESARPSRLLFCRECSEGKHPNCDGTAWDNEADAPTSCTCPDRSHQ